MMLGRGGLRSPTNHHWLLPIYRQTSRPSSLSSLPSLLQWPGAAPLSSPSLGLCRQSHHLYGAPFLQACKANYEPLSPMSFLKRTVDLFPRRQAVAYRDVSRTWAEQYTRIKKLSSALFKAGVRPGDTVSVMSLNTPPIFEAHFAIPGLRAVINTINTRLDAAIVAFQLEHGECKVLFTDTEHSAVMEEALQILDQKKIPRPLVVDIVDPYYLGDGKRLGKWEYEDFLARGDESFDLSCPENEYEAISLNYTSGTTGNPKGVVGHHRGVYLNCVGNILSWDMRAHSNFLHIVPLFHCNGWVFPYTVTALAGTHVFTRWVRADVMFEAMVKHDVQFFNGAPTVMNILLQSPKEHRRDLRGRDIKMMTAGAPPPPPVMKAMYKELGIKCVTAYGLTETYGPSTICILDDAAEYPDASPRDKDEQMQWQVVNHGLEEMMVADPKTLQPVPKDGKTIGEVFVRGNVVMNGYLKNEKATKEAFEGGWFHTGDLAVAYKNGRIQIRDRSKDIIISGGENICTIELENVIVCHDAVLEVAVVAEPHEKWGEVPCAFVSLKDGHELTEDELIAWARGQLARYKVPKRVVFKDLPKTSTGKVQKYVLREWAKQLQKKH